MYAARRRRLSFLAPQVALAGSLILSVPGGSPPPTQVSLPTAPPLPALHATLPDVTAAPWSDAARALRQQRCPAALGALEPAAAGTGPEASFARTVRGLYARACEQVDRAENLLEAAATPGGVLEDWRLLTLADASRALGHTDAARAALAHLLGDYPASPLRSQALLEAARLAWEEGDAPRALALIGWGRERHTSSETETSLDELAWEIGTVVGERRVQEEAARRLLVDAPDEAERLGVLAVLAPSGTPLPLAALLGTPELEARARTLLGERDAETALDTLAAVPVEDRDTGWALLEAEALTRDRRGREALLILEGRRSGDRATAAHLELARALAATEAATVRRGRANLASAEREKLEQTAEKHLRRSARLTPDPHLERRALRLLFEKVDTEERFDEVLAILRRLRRLDPTDATGVDTLFERGWEAFRQRNYSGAVGYWAELVDLYPGDRSSRRGHYWMGRAFEALGDRERARELYREVAAADVTDFYRKNALARLAGGPLPAEPLREREPWPREARLERAEMLSDLGLDELALAEVSALSGSLEAGSHRAVAALESRILAREGELRESVRRIRIAFPSLGGPHQGSVPEEALRLYYPLSFERTIRTNASRYGLPLAVVLGMIRQESAFDTGAHSHAGARGLMQVMPTTGRELARRMGLRYSTRRLTDPAFNVRLGTAYFRQVMDMFGGNVELALAGYNGGPYRIRRLWREAKPGTEVDTFVEDLRIGESKTYVKRILVLADSYRRLYLDGGGTGGIGAS